MRKLFIVAGLCGSFAVHAQEAVWPAKTHYRFVTVEGDRMFFREAGDPANLSVVLLHGYPSSSHTYRELIPLLSGRYHVIAPDNLGSGYSAKPAAETTEYTFDLLALRIEQLLERLSVRSYVLYMQDFGAPVGFRLMMRHPEQVRAIVAQNANAYLEGIPEAKQTFFRRAQTDKSPRNVAALFEFTSPQAIEHKQYRRDVKGRESIMSPDSWTHDGHFLATAAERDIQVELFQDYKTNLDSYPKWQKLLREHRFPTLLVWGERDPVFTAAGARAYLKDVPEAELHLIDAGHFAAEEKPVEIAKHLVRFLARFTRSPD